MKIHMSIEAEGTEDLAVLANMLAPFINEDTHSTYPQTPITISTGTETSPTPETMAEAATAAVKVGDEGDEEVIPVVEPDPEPEKPKRKRRTKAEMEAARAAEAAGETADQPAEETAGVNLDMDEEPAAAAAEEPVVKPSPKNDDGLSVQDLVAHVRTYLEGGGDGEKVREILAEHGYERVSKVAVKDVSAVAASLRGLIDG